MNVREVRQRGSLRTVVAAWIALGLGNGAPSAGVHAEEIPDRWAGLLKDIVEINSKSENVQGSARVRARLIPEFEALGFTATPHDVGEGHTVVSLEFPGAKPELLLVGHVDTVFPPDSPFQKLASDGDLIRGPGVIDMKGGLVLVLNALADLKEKDPALLRRVRVAINDDEETGSLHSGAALLELAKGLRGGLVFEPGLEDGALVTGHSGIHWIRLRVKGKAAHAGLEPEKGINACVELAHKLARVHELNDFARRLTVTVGMIRGGSAVNAVCEEAWADIDIRYVDRRDLERVLEKLEAVKSSSTVKNPVTGAPTSAEITVLSDVSSMPESSTRELFGIARAAGKAVGQAPEGRRVGYASDANDLARTGLPLLVGLGPYGGGMHTASERMLKSSYGARLRLVEAMIPMILAETRRLPDAAP